MFTGAQTGTRHKAELSAAFSWNLQPHFLQSIRVLTDWLTGWAGWLIDTSLLLFEILISNDDLQQLSASLKRLIKFSFFSFRFHLDLASFSEVFTRKCASISCIDTRDCRFVLWESWNLGKIIVIYGSLITINSSRSLAPLNRTSKRRVLLVIDPHRHFDQRSTLVSAIPRGQTYVEEKVNCSAGQKLSEFTNKEASNNFASRKWDSKPPDIHSIRGLSVRLGSARLGCVLSCRVHLGN